MIKSYIFEILQNVLKKLEIENINIILDYPKNPENGDISTNIAMLLAKPLKKQPKVIAQELIAKLDYSSDFIEKIEIAGNGFINFFLSSKYYHNILNKIISSGVNFGKQEIGLNQKVLVEYVSANPTGLLHLGHGRNAVIGDTLSNLYEWLGYDVTREYYFNNAGNQMRNLAKSIYARYRQLLDDKNYPFPEDGYFGEYIIEIAKAFIQQNGTEILEPTEENLLKFQRFGEEWNFANIKRTLQKLNTVQNSYYNENSLYETGKINKLIEDLTSLNLIYKKDDALWLKLTALGMEDDRVAVKSTGEPTYRLPDIAYHREKFLRGFDEIVDIFGSDHIATVPDVIATIKALGFDTNKIKVVIHQFVTLTENGQQVKMSKRSGKSYTLDELIDEVGADVVRFFLLMRGVNTHLEFDLNLAKEQSDKNPVYYLQYAHARICSILEKIKEQNIVVNDAPNLQTLQEKIELDLIKKLADFPVAIFDACKKSEPHILSDYLRDVASIFHNFYHQCRIIGETQDLLSARLILANSTKIVLKNGLKILGVSAPERM
jgi:arginyl-tRNA synthetase